MCIMLKNSVQHSPGKGHLAKAQWTRIVCQADAFILAFQMRYQKAEGCRKPPDSCLDRVKTAGRPHAIAETRTAVTGFLLVLFLSAVP